MTISVEVIGFTYRPCGPFPCDDDRQCGLTECFEKLTLKYAYPALVNAVAEKYGDKVSMKLVSLDDGVPDYVADIVRENHPPLPIILVNGKLVPIGAISVPKITEYIDKEL